MVRRHRHGTAPRSRRRTEPHRSSMVALRHAIKAERAQVAAAVLQRASAVDALDDHVLRHILSFSHGLRWLRAAGAACWRWHIVAKELEAEWSALEVEGHLGSRRGSAPGQLNVPSQVAPREDGGIFVADSHNHRLVGIRPDGEMDCLMGVHGDSCGEFRFPKGVACDSEALYVADCNNCRVQKLACDGTFIAMAGTFGHGDGQFQRPYSLALSGTSLFVADSGNHRIVVVDVRRMDIVTSFGGRGAGLDQLNNPRGLFAVGDLLYVADTSNHRVCCLRQDGAFVRKFGSGYGTIPGQLAFPSDVTVSPGGSLVVVVERRERVTVFDEYSGWPLQVLQLGGPRGHSSGLNSICSVETRSNSRRTRACKIFVSANDRIHLLRLEEKAEEEKLQSGVQNEKYAQP
eukprot:6172373-Pleurochrysis_carterae.AAC.2